MTEQERYREKEDIVQGKNGGKGELERIHEGNMKNNTIN